MTTPFPLSPRIFHHLQFNSSNPHPNKNTILQFHAFQIKPLHVSRRISNSPQEIDDSVYDRRSWSTGSRRGRGFDDYRYEDVDGDEEDGDGDDDDDDDEDDRSLDLLVKFMQNVFKNVSRRGRKAVRLVLPPSISTKLVAFSVDGVLMLTFLWILKAFLEVVCTLACVVFISILLIRGIWASVSYLQENHINKSNKFDGDYRAWIGARPAT